MVARQAVRLGESGYQIDPDGKYFTEAWVTQALLTVVRLRGMVWEPACGRGDMVDVLRGAHYKVVASDIHGDRLGCEGAAELDFLKATSPGDATFSICTNPPYGFAEEFIRHALELTRRSSGMVAMLLRNEYDSSRRRRYLFEQEAFRCKYVLTKRPMWRDTGHVGAPRHNFSWFLWDWNNSAPATIKYLP